MTLSLMGRLFGVPLVIIGSIVGGAVIVVFTFGAPAAQRDRSLDTLLTALEAGTGEKSLGMLLPRDKQHWQTGLELTMRLSKKGEFSDDQLQQVAKRLGIMIRAELGKGFKRTTSSQTLAPGPSLGQHRFSFLIRALGKTERPEAIDPLLEVVSHADESFAVLAMAELGNLAHVPGIHGSLPVIVERAKTLATPEGRIVACTVLSVIAEPTNRDVIAVLTSLLRSQDGEVGWSAALALARLGNAAGKSTLLDLLDRSFWESGQRYHTVSEDGTVLRYRMPEGRIVRNLVTALEAVGTLSDPDVWDMIERLREDPRPSVRTRATEMLASRTETSGTVSGGTEN
ncbi:MAG: HEAT repeat domain-containing protein [Planctomycetes bacterium]|nr:HEAT repeat domain-containing protein [Planctomycetota bacterium]